MLRERDRNSCQLFSNCSNCIALLQCINKQRERERDRDKERESSTVGQMQLKCFIIFVLHSACRLQLVAPAAASFSQLLSLLVDMFPDF